VLNRLGQAVASTDGTFVPEIDAKSWIGKNKSTHPYTQEEQAMLKMAYKPLVLTTKISTVATWTVKKCQKSIKSVLLKVSEVIPDES
jgi:hypothetical protein